MCFHSTILYNIIYYHDVSCRDIYWGYPRHNWAKRLRFLAATWQVNEDVDPRMMANRPGVTKQPYGNPRGFRRWKPSGFQQPTVAVPCSRNHMKTCPITIIDCWRVDVLLCFTFRPSQKWSNVHFWVACLSLKYDRSRAPWVLGVQFRFYISCLRSSFFKSY